MIETTWNWFELEFVQDLKTFPMSPNLFQSADKYSFYSNFTFDLEKSVFEMKLKEF